MDSISKYIFRQTALVMFFVTIVFSFVVWLTQSLRFVDMVVNRGLPVTEFLWLAMLILPRFLAVILPISSVIAAIYVYNRLISDRELVVLRAAGFSNLRLVRPAILVALLTAFIVYLLNIYLLPVSFRQFTELRLAIKSDFSSALLQEGAFQTLPGGITVFIRERGGAGRLNGVLVHDATNRNRPVTYMARSGQLIHTESGPRAVLIEGVSQQISPDGLSVTTLRFEKYAIDLSVAGSEARIGRKRNPEEMFLWELFAPELKGDPRGIAYLAEGHSRIASPFMALAFILTALAILVSGDFSRRGQANRVALAVMVFVALQTTGIAVHNLASDDARAIPLLYGNIVIPVLIGLYALGPGAARRRRPRLSRAGAG